MLQGDTTLMREPASLDSVEINSNQDTKDLAATQLEVAPVDVISEPVSSDVARLTKKVSASNNIRVLSYGDGSSNVASLNLPGAYSSNSVPPDISEIKDITIDPSVGVVGSLYVVSDPTPHLGLGPSGNFTITVDAAMRNYDETHGTAQGTELIHQTLSYYAKKGDLDVVRYIMEDLGKSYGLKYDYDRIDEYELVGDNYYATASQLRDNTTVVTNNKCGPSHEVLANHYKHGGATKALVISHETLASGHTTALAQYNNGEYIHQDWGETEIIKAPSVIEADKLLCGGSDVYSTSGMAEMFGLSENSYYREFILPNPYNIDKNDKERVLSLPHTDVINDLKLSQKDIETINQLTNQVKASGLTSGEISYKVISGRDSNGDINGSLGGAEINAYTKDGYKIRFRLDAAGLSNEEFVKGVLDVFSQDQALRVQFESGKAEESGKNLLFNRGYKGNAVQNKILCAVKIKRVGLSVQHEYVEGKVDASTQTLSNNIKASYNAYSSLNSKLSCSVDILRTKPLALETGVFASNEVLPTKTNLVGFNGNISERQVCSDWRVKFGPFIGTEIQLPTAQNYNTVIKGKAALLRVGDSVGNNPSEQDYHMKINGSQIELEGSLSIHNPKNGLGGTVGLAYANLDVPKSARKQIREARVVLHSHNTVGMEGLDTSVGVSVGEEKKDIQLTGCKEPLERNYSKEFSANVGYTLPTRSKAWRIEGEITHKEEKDTVTKIKDEETQGSLSVLYRF